MGPRCLLGKSSPSTKANDSWPAAAMPLSSIAGISCSTLWAVTAMIHAITQSELDMRHIHLRPKMSERRPTSRKPTPEPNVQAVATP